MEKRTGWFADIDPEEAGTHRWQPCLETGTGHIPSLPVWFATQPECESWIRETVIGAGMIDD